MSFVLLVGCTEFEGIEQQTTGVASSTGPAASGSSSGTSTTANTSADGSGDGVTTNLTDPTGNAETTGDDDGSTGGDSSTGGSESTGSVAAESSSGGEAFPYAGDYAGTFTVRCGLDFDGTVSANVADDGNITGTASAGGESTPVTGTVSPIGVVAGSFSIVAIPCNLAGTLADDGTGGSGMYSCPSVSCSGPWTMMGV